MVVDVFEVVVEFFEEIVCGCRWFEVVVGKSVLVTMTTEGTMSHIIRYQMDNKVSHIHYYCKVSSEDLKVSPAGSCELHLNFGQNLSR